MGLLLDISVKISEFLEINPNSFFNGLHDGRFEQKKNHPEFLAEKVPRHSEVFKEKTQ